MAIPGAVLQNANIGQAIDTSGIAQAFQHASDLRQRQQEYMQRRKEEAAQQGYDKRTKAMTDLMHATDAKNFFVGGGSPVVTDKLYKINQYGADMAKQGYETSQIQMAIAPMLAEVTDYSNKTKAIADKINASKQYFEKGKYGYDTPALTDAAFHRALFKQDPQSGKWIPKTNDELDTEGDYMAQELHDAPEKYTNSQQLVDYAKQAPLMETAPTFTTDEKGVKHTVGYDAKLPSYQEIATDSNGKPYARVRGEQWTDDNHKPMINPLTKQPYMMAPDDIYNDVMMRNPQGINFIRGQARQAFTNSGKPIPDEGSQQFKGMEKAILYEVLNNNKTGYFKPKDIQTNSALKTQIELHQDPISRILFRDQLKGGTGGSTPKLTASDRHAFDKYKEDVQTKYDAYSSKLDAIDSLDKGGSTDSLKGSINKYGRVKSASKDWFGNGYTVKYEDNKGATQKKEFKNKEEMVNWLQEGDDQVIDPESIDINEWMQSRNGGTQKTPTKTKTPPSHTKTPTVPKEIPEGYLNQ